MQLSNFPKEKNALNFIFLLELRFFRLNQYTWTAFRREKIPLCCGSSQNLIRWYSSSEIRIWKARVDEMMVESMSLAASDVSCFFFSLFQFPFTLFSLCFQTWQGSPITYKEGWFLLIFFNIQHLTKTLQHVRRFWWDLTFSWSWGSSFFQWCYISLLSFQRHVYELVDVSALVLKSEERLQTAIWNWMLKYQYLSDFLCTSLWPAYADCEVKSSIKLGPSYWGCSWKTLK